MKLLCRNVLFPLKARKQGPAPAASLNRLLFFFLSLGRIIPAGVVNELPQLLNAIIHSVPRGPRAAIVSGGSVCAPARDAWTAQRPELMLVREALRSGSGGPAEGEAVGAKGAGEGCCFPIPQLPSSARTARSAGGELVTVF